MPFLRVIVLRWMRRIATWYKYIGGNIVNNNDNFNEWTDTLLYKNIPLTLYSRRGDVSCVWEVRWRRGQTATYWPQVLLTIAALLSHSGWAAQPWVMEGPSPLSGAGLTLLASYLQLTQAVCVLVIFLFYVHLLPLIYTGVSLDWRLGRGSICNKCNSLTGVRTRILQCRSKAR